MPDLCFYAPWIMKEPIPDPFRVMLEKAGKKRVSYDEADCSMRNIRKQGKVSRLHGPTLQALLTLIQIRKEKDSGAAGIQRGRDTINYFCMEYPGNQGKYVMTYNSKNGRFSGILKTEEKNEKLPGIREGKNTGEQYLALLAYARMIAQILGLPYYVFTCGPGTDELELLATTVPNMGGTAHLEMELPRLEDIEMDPASALATVNGIYEEGISREKAFQEILKAVYEKGYEKSKNEKDFLLKESEIVKACREPSVIEIQEPAMIEKPGTLTRLNSLFDDGAVTDLVNGEQIRRNPDTIVIMTTNLDYVGCQNFNQSVLSRMNLIQPKEALTEEEMAKRAMKRTGFKNKELLSFMAATVCKIHEYLIEQDITDGVCGYRELENWVLSYMVSNDLRRSAWTALLSKASMDREEQGTMERVFLLPHCAVD